MMPRGGRGWRGGGLEPGGWRAVAVELGGQLLLVGGCGAAGVVTWAARQGNGSAWQLNGSRYAALDSRFATLRIGVGDPQASMLSLLASNFTTCVRDPAALAANGSRTLA